ncbi:hypothetical protein Tco_0308887, partial [Tanacetum coccineum]
HEEALARLMVNEYTGLNVPYRERKSQNVEVFFEINKKELELKQQELKMREYERRSRDETLYLQPIVHLTGARLKMALEMKRMIKER